MLVNSVYYNGRDLEKLENLESLMQLSELGVYFPARRINKISANAIRSFVQAKAEVAGAGHSGFVFILWRLYDKEFAYGWKGIVIYVMRGQVGKLQ